MHPQPQHGEEQEPFLLTEREAAEKCRVSTKKLYRARCAGELAYVQLGQAIRYRPADLERWIAAKTTPAAK